MAKLTMIDRILADNPGAILTKNQLESFEYDGIKLIEIKAPPRGKQIFRLLAYREKDWDLFVAVADVKRSTALPAGWKDTAANRVKDALKEGLPL
jgi:hypothetical protein